MTSHGHRFTHRRRRGTLASRAGTAALVLAALALGAGTARADLCSDSVGVRFAMFPTTLPVQVACPGVELACAGPDLGLPGPCRFAIDLGTETIRIEFTVLADYGPGAAFTFSDLDCLVCNGTVAGTLATAELSFVNASGFVPEVEISGDSVRVSIAGPGVVRWKPGEFIELRLRFEGDCPLPPVSHRSGWVPNVGVLGPGELPLGDLFLFTCPDGGAFRATVDTKDDLDASASCLDPVVEIYDGAGDLIAVGDDQLECTYPPVCGFGCPEVEAVCGAPGLHSLVVRDYGTAAVGDEHCGKGGGYELTVEVSDAAGVPLAGDEIALGAGGPARDLPAWVRELGLSPTGPNLDDENVPSFRVFSAFGSQARSKGGE